MPNSFRVGDVLYVAACDDVGTDAPEQWIYARSLHYNEEGYVPSHFLTRVTRAAIEIELVPPRAAPFATVSNVGGLTTDGGGPSLRSGAAGQVAMELQDLDQMHAAESTLHDHLVEFAPVIGQLTATEERFKSMARLADLAVQRARLTERLTQLLADNLDLPRAQFGRARSWIQRCDQKRTEDSGADGEDASPSGMKPSGTWSSMDTVGSRSSTDPDEEPLPETAAEASASAPVGAHDYDGDAEGDDGPEPSRPKKGRRRRVPPLPPPPAKGILKAPLPAPPPASEPAELVAIKQIKRVLLCLPGTRLGGVVQLFQPGRVDAIPPTQLEEFRKQAAAGTLPHVDEHWWTRGNVPVRDWPTPTLYGGCLV